MVDEEKLPVSQWSSEEVGLWLENIGYGDYYKEFVNDNRIDGQVLLILTENDLKDSLGIRVLGDRKRLWLAINKLQQEHSKSALNLDTYSRKKSLDFKDSAYISSSDSNDDEEGSNSLSLADVSETWRTFLSVLYAFLVFCLTSFVMTVVHDRVPDMKKYPPLPDIILDSVPLIPWAFTMCEFTGIVLWSMWVAVLFLHKHRMILIRRMMALAGTVFLLRCVTMFVTSLSVPGIHLECSGKLYGDVWAKLHRAFEIMFGFGMSVNGVRSCGDYMFSGHTVVITLLNFFITEYTPRYWYYLHTACWVLNLFGIFFILAAHEHYSIDVLIAFYISSRLFLYYHTLANSLSIKKEDKRTKVWFPLFSFFEENVNGRVPNEYEWPLKIPEFLKFRSKKHE
ncbi:predicted protein [Nematostella vectensis]|uniref:SAM domain-containing protein n=1 Tax=Nematostella vectensis TaxID=45351 RepID=A7S0Z2_NEMVE|nr:predicted protein [Nematostella vectensis]|eukprot:XP_001634688.1 predicted protein [Nematostella vectensis]